MHCYHGHTNACRRQQAYMSTCPSSARHIQFARAIHTSGITHACNVYIHMSQPLHTPVDTDVITCTCIAQRGREDTRCANITQTRAYVCKIHTKKQNKTHSRRIVSTDMGISYTDTCTHARSMNMHACTRMHAHT